MNLFTIPPNAPFLDAIATEWLRRSGDDPLAVARGLILLPTRRAARSLAEAFLRVSDGKPLLLPRIASIGGLDETQLALSGALELAPAVEPAQRLATLTRLILMMDGKGGAPRTADRAWLLAGELAALMDEAELAGIDLAARLPDAADPAFAEHWKQTLTFLRIVTSVWPDWLAEQDMLNPADRQVQLLLSQAEAWEKQPPADPLLVAGVTGGVPAVARLLGVVARLPNGAVVLPGLDGDLADDAWDAIEDTHPQAGMRALLAGLGATRGDVRPWPAPAGPAPEGRLALLRKALLPAKALAGWQAASPGLTEGLSGVRLLDPVDQQEEAVAIALLLRDALETPGQRAALVTPDRGLAGRVTAELLRFGVVADDSAGEKLAETPPAVFLRLLIRAVAEELAPVALLALLKHPLAAAGLQPAACRAAARDLETLCLRGPRPRPGLTGLRLALDHAEAGKRRDQAVDLLARIEHCLEPVFRVAPSPVTPRLVVSPAQALSALIEAGERLAETDSVDGPSRLWAAEEGEELATHLAPLLAALPVLPDQPRGSLAGLFDAVLQDAVVRSRRALRGRDGAEHPRIFIWGLLEARLQSADLIVLGGLSEGVWPPATDPGPWMSRLMRARVGLPSPEERVGQAAHDFVSAACAAPEIVLSCPRRRDGAPAVPARWLERLRAYLDGQKLRLIEHKATGWARALDQPEAGPRPVAPPRPCPAVRLRPRQLSVTEIETWLRDPYAIYARHVLKLRALDPLDQATEAADYGSIVHAGLHRFLRELGTAWPDDAAERLRTALGHAMADADLREALLAWWSPRLGRIAAWVAETEIERRTGNPPASLVSEAKGTYVISRPGGIFTLVGRADRIERRADGKLVFLDYKTGTVPSQKDVQTGLAAQLPLEACMAAAGAFGAAWQGEAAELAYWHLSGGYEAGTVHTLFKGDEALVGEGIATAQRKLIALIDSFDDPERCYLSQPDPGRAPRFPVYGQLARIAEWEAAGDEE